MATIDWPTDRAFMPADFTVGADVPLAQWRAPNTGTREVYSRAADRMTCQLSLPPCKRDDAARIESFLAGLLSTGDNVRFPMFHRRTPRGSMQQPAAVATTAVAGSRSISIAESLSRQNILRRADVYGVYGLSGWSTFNGTVSGGEIGPDGQPFAVRLNRTATGNHSCWQVLPTASHANKTVTCRIWLKSGTLTGSVALRIRDGALLTDIAAVNVNPTSTWTQYSVTGTFGGSPAANVAFIVDPDNDVGAAGDTLLMWTAEIEQVQGQFFNSGGSSIGVWSDPTGAAQAARLVSAGAGVWYWINDRTRAAAAGETWTFSVWLKAGTYTGSVGVGFQGNGVDVVRSTVTPSGTWTRFAATGTLATSVSTISGFVAPTSSALGAGETVFFYGPQLELGSSATQYDMLPSLQGGDFIGVGGNLLQVAYGGAVGNYAGQMTVPLAYPLQKTASAAAAVTAAEAAGVWQLDTAGITFDYSAGVIMNGLVLPFRQVIA